MTRLASVLRKRVVIQQNNGTRNSSGGMLDNWQTVPGCSSVPSRVVYPPPSKKGDEQFTQQQVRSSLFATWTIRYRPSQNISPAMRIVYGTRTFEIRTVLLVDEYKQEVTLQCEELQATGTMH